MIKYYMFRYIDDSKGLEREVEGQQFMWGRSGWLPTGSAGKFITRVPDTVGLLMGAKL